MTAFDVIIAGAGIVGAAIAEALAGSQRVLLLEQHAQPGTETSARNSEVIHAGFYYPPGSLKAQWCRDGRDRLYRFCADHGIAHRRCGKLLVATTAAEIPALERLAANAQATGIRLHGLDAAAVRAREPQLQAVAALLSPDSGILDSHALLQVLLARAQAAGATLACGSRLERVHCESGAFVLHGHSRGEPFTLRTRQLVNAAGLHAQTVAAGIDGLAAQHIPPLHRLKGHYFRLTGRSPFTHLVYPVPEAGLAGLGIHATPDLGGGLRFGPDTLPVDALDYGVPPDRAALFEAAIRRYWPHLPSNALQPDTAGIRPRLAAAGFSDFLLQDAGSHGLPGLLQLFGIDSPGLTACLAIAAAVRERLAA